MPFLFPSPFKLHEDPPFPLESVYGYENVNGNEKRAIPLTLTLSPRERDHL